jgi:two-component system nitrogen regulation response regulator NtrX
MRILIVDDDPAICRSLEDLVREEGHCAVSCYSGEQALSLAGENPFDAALLDVMLPGMSGLETLDLIKKKCTQTQVLMMSGRSDIGTAVRAVQKGAYQFFEKPIDPDQLLFELRNLERQKTLEAKVASLENLVEADQELIGESDVMIRLKQDILKAAPSEGRVLIFGENGTGKELVARAVHRLNRRKDKPFVSLNCAAIPQSLVESELFGYEKGAFTGATARKRGLFESADGGSLFLDEIGDMGIETQSKLLRVLQENEAVRVGGKTPYRFDVRFISATNKNLADAIASNLFREDLFYRLNVIPLHIPPLRERGRDIVLLAEVFLDRISRKTGKGMKEWNAEAQDLLVRYSWPGNVRELKNAVERLVIMGEGKTITRSDVAQILPAPKIRIDIEGGPSPDDDMLSLKESVNRYEGEILRRGFIETKGNVSLLARRLKVDRANLHRKLKAYRIK